MSSFKIGMLAVALGFALCIGEMAQAQGRPISKDELKSGKDAATNAYKAAMENCKSLAGNAKDICNAEAKAREKADKAELDARYENTEKAWYNARIARADGDYAVAREKCDDKAGNVKDVCLKEAAAAYTSAKANAKVQRTAGEGQDKVADARRDASTDKRNAEFALAKEKCDTFAGEAKTRCINDAKARYGKF